VDPGSTSNARLVMTVFTCFLSILPLRSNKTQPHDVLEI
jgi:hypothetical protein